MVSAVLSYYLTLGRHFGRKLPNKYPKNFAYFVNIQSKNPYIYRLCFT